VPSAPSAYEPRYDRAESIPTNTSATQAAQTTSPAGYPNVRLWPFGFHRTANAWRVVWSPAFKGPAVIWDLVLVIRMASIPLMRMDIARSRGINQGGAGFSPSFGEALWEQPPAIGEDVTVYNTTQGGLAVAGTGASPPLTFAYPIGRLITYDQFFIALINSAGDLASAAQASGYVRVVEGDSAEGLRGFF
jgi:hypothetical protein